MIRVAVPLVSVAYRDPIPGKRPQFLDEPVVHFLGPLAREERDDFVPPIDEFRSVPPAWNRSCMPGLLCSVATIPSIFREAHVLHRTVASELAR